MNKKRRYIFVTLRWFDGTTLKQKRIPVLPIERMKGFWEKHFKPHCPDCDGIMDVEMIDMVLDKLVYKCRDCGKEWV